MRGGSQVSKARPGAPITLSIVRCPWDPKALDIAPWPNEAQAITMERCVPCSAALLVSPREQAAAPVKLRTPVLAAGVFVGHPDGHGRPSGCLPPLAGRSHFRSRTQPQRTRPDHSAFGPQIRHKSATDCSFPLPQRVGHCGRDLVVDNYLRQARIPFDDVEAVEPVWWYRGRLVRIRFRHRTPFGSLIYYMPKWGPMRAMFDTPEKDLQRLIWPRLP